MIVRLDIPDGISTELNAYASRHGFASVKQMVVAHLRDCVRHERLDKLNENVVSGDTVKTDDVVIN